MKKTQPLFSGFENCIWECIGKRAMALVMNRADIQKFALEAAIKFHLSTEEFKASSHWLDNFLKRYELSLRRSTTLLKLFVDGIGISKYQLSNLFAVDATAIFLGQ